MTILTNLHNKHLWLSAVSNFALLLAAPICGVLEKECVFLGNLGVLSRLRPMAVELTFLLRVGSP